MLAAVLVCVVPANASAEGPRLGQVAPPYDASSACSDCTVVQEQTPPPYSYEEPPGGHLVITSWAFMAGSVRASWAFDR